MVIKKKGLIVSLLLICGNLAIKGELYISVDSTEFDIKSNIKISQEKERYQIEYVSETLNLTRSNIHSIEYDIIKSDNIQNIILRDNLLKTIPQKILDNLPNVKYLDLSKNNINIFENNLIEHDKLEVLDLCCQNKLFDPTALEINDLNNNVMNLSDFKLFYSDNMYLPNLKRLDLSDNLIRGITQQFALSFPTLTHLYLHDIKAEAILSHFFDYLPATLQTLHLESNNFTDLILNNMAEITELYLDRNFLQNITITSKKLRILSLSQNIYLENFYLDIPNLEKLDMSASLKLFTLNDILDQSVNCDRLQTLLLEHNRLNNIPLLFYTELKELSLAHNWLSYVSANSFLHLKSLRKLSLNGNQIKMIEPNAFYGLGNLEFLDLSNNQLTNLPNNWIVPFQNLQYFNAKSNNLESISKLALNPTSKIWRVSIKDNRISRISRSEIDLLPYFITVYI